MSTTIIQCPKCKEILPVVWRTAGYGHGATDEVLGIDRAIKNHKCKGVSTK